MNLSLNIECALLKQDTHRMHTRTVKAVCQSNHLICAATKISAAPTPWS